VAAHHRVHDCTCMLSPARSLPKMLSSVSTGFERPSASSSNWRSSYTKLFTAMAPQYLSGQLRYVADLLSRHGGRLRSSTSSLLDVRPSRLVTIGDRSFAAAGSRLWNSLPVDVQSAPLLATFRQTLKTHLFRQSYPDIVFFHCFAIVVLEVTVT